MLEKYLKMQGRLEKSLKTEFALKSAWKLIIDLEISKVLDFHLFLCSRQLSDSLKKS